jgi:rhodanese-related sulfurtransferase
VHPTSDSDVSPAEAAALVEQGALLLDVREDDEWAAVHAAAATHVPMSRLSAEARDLPTDRTIVCVCHVGGRSAMVTEALNRGGWTAVNVMGGMQAWEAAGLPVVR